MILKIGIILCMLMLPVLGCKVYNEPLPWWQPILDDAIYVEYVYDGDTIALSNGKSIRIIGVNSVEKKEDGYDQFGKLLANSVINKPVEVTYFRTRKGKIKKSFKRFLGIVHVIEKSGKKTCINAKMRDLTRGYKDYDKYDNKLTKKQREALIECGWQE